MGKKLQVFVSSAMTGELDTERAVVRTLFESDAALKDLCSVYLIDDHASSRKIDKAYREEVKGSNILIVILGGLYREAVADEVVTAINNHVDIYAFIKDNVSNRESALCEFIEKTIHKNAQSCSYWNPKSLTDVIKDTIIDELCRKFNSNEKLESPLNDYSSWLNTRKITNDGDDLIVESDNCMAYGYAEITKSNERWGSEDYMANIPPDQLVVLAEYVATEKFNYKMALGMLNRAIYLDRNNWRAYHNMGQVYSNMGRDDDSFLYYKRTLEINDKSHSTWHNLGIYYYGKGDYAKAMECFKTAVKLFPNKYSSMSYMFSILVINESYKEALEYAQKAYAIKMDDVSIPNLAIGFALNGDISKANSIADEMESGTYNEMLVRLTVFQLSSNYKGELSVLDNMFSKYGYGNNDLIIKKAKCLLNLGKLDDLREWIRFVDEEAILDAAGYNNIGFAIQGNSSLSDLTIHLYNTAVYLNPKVNIFWLNLQAIYGNLGMAEEGIKASKNALEHFPNDSRIINNYMKLLTELNRFNEAFEFVFKQILSISNVDISDEIRSLICDSIRSGVDYQNLVKMLTPFHK